MLKTLPYLLISLLIIFSACKRRNRDSTSNLAAHYLAMAAHNELTGNKKYAIKDYDSLIKLEPYKPEGYYLRAIIDTSIRDCYGSVRDIDTAISLLPKDDKMRLMVYLSLRGDVKRLAGKGNDAVADYQAAIQICDEALNKYAGNDFAKQEKMENEEKLKAIVAKL